LAQQNLRNVPIADYGCPAAKKNDNKEIWISPRLLTREKM
jgi:hypothetical protein